MKKIYTFLLYQLLLITSCVSNNTSKNSVLKSIDCKDPIQKNLQEITISSSNFIYGNPYQMKVVDSLLLIVDKWDNHFLTIINRNTNELCGRYLSIGRGPGEVLPPISIECQNDSLYVLERQTYSGRITAWAIQDLLSNKYKRTRVFYLPKARRITGTGTGFITSGTFEDNLLHEYNASNDSLFLNCNFYPDFLAQTGESSNRYFVGQGSISFQNNCLALTHDYLGEIKFYSKNNSGYVLNSLYTIGNSQNIKNRVKQGNFKIHRDDPIYFSFNGISASKNAFYILLENGISNEAVEKNSILLKFDLHGTFVESYHFDSSILCFTVTSDNTLYAITTSDKSLVLSKIQL